MTIGLAAGVTYAAFASPAQQGSTRLQTADALPNWSGVWEPVQGDVFDARANPAPGDARAQPPYRREYEARYVETLAKLKADPTIDPLQQCHPLGLLRMMSLGGDFEFAVTPEVIWVFSQTAPGPGSTGTQSRRIYADGRPQLAGDDLFPTYTGNSIGRWEGDTLVVRTVGLNEGNFVDRTGAMLSPDAVVTERIRLIAPDVLEDQFTIDDKTALTRPWVVTRTWRRKPGQTSLSTDSCLGRRVNPADLTDAAWERRQKPSGRGGTP